MNTPHLDILRRYYQAFNAGDWETMLTQVTEDVIHDGNQGQRAVGKETFRTFLQTMARHYRETLTDFCFFAAESGDRAAAEFICRGEYLVAQSGLPPARGQSYQLPVGAFFEFKDGRIARITNYYNLKEWIRQVEA